MCFTLFSYLNYSKKYALKYYLQLIFEEAGFKKRSSDQFKSDK